MTKQPRNHILVELFGKKKNLFLKKFRFSFLSFFFTIDFRFDEAEGFEKIRGFVAIGNFKSRTEQSGIQGRNPVMIWPEQYSVVIGIFFFIVIMYDIVIFAVSVDVFVVDDVLFAVFFVYVPRESVIQKRNNLRDARIGCEPNWSGPRRIIMKKIVFAVVDQKGKHG